MPLRLWIGVTCLPRSGRRTNGHLVDKRVEGTCTVGKAVWIAGLVLMCVGSGCGMYDCDVFLSYDRTVAGVRSDQGGIVYVESPACPGLILAAGQSRSVVVGDVDIGGMPGAGRMVTIDSVPQWIADALCVELKAAGFTPQVVDNLPTTADRGIRTRLVKIWVDGSCISTLTPVDATANVHLRMVLSQRGSIVKEFDVMGYGTANADKSLTIALENCMKKAMPTIVTGLGG